MATNALLFGGAGVPETERVYPLAAFELDAERTRTRDAGAPVLTLAHLVKQATCTVGRQRLGALPFLCNDREGEAATDRRGALGS